MRRQIVVLAVVLLASVSTAWANITYNIVDYPAAQADYFQPGTDTVSGFIVTDGGMGALSRPNFVTAYLSLTTPQGTFTGILSLGGAFTCYATPTQLLLVDLNNNAVQLVGYGPILSGPPPTQDVLFIEWYPLAIYSAKFGDQWAGDITGFASNGIGLPGPWVIAEVPEPATLSLLALGGLALLRRHKGRHLTGG